MRILLYKYDDFVKEITLEPGNTYKIGRKSTCDMVLEKLPGISREHFTIEEEDSGRWHVNVLSEVKLITLDGEERRDFMIEGDGEFHLSPFTFKHVAAEQQTSQFNESIDTTNTPAPLMQPDTEDLNEPGQEGQADGNIDSETFSGNDEQTAIQSFKGLPYIKILGEGGKKSEYFRLEGNLWIVGGDEKASVHLRDPSVANSHFEISRTDKGFFVIDLGSPQGTHLNGQKITARKPQRLLSGDILSVGQTSLQFELRDNAFKRKVSNIPLNMYKNPLVFFEQDVAMVSLNEEQETEGDAVAIEDFDPAMGKKKRMRMVLMAVAAIMVMWVVSSELDNSASEKAQKVTGQDPYSQLAPEQKKIVKRTYRLAEQFYLQRKYGNALNQLQKLHEIIPYYKDSKRKQEDCINFVEMQRQKAALEKQRRIQEEQIARVNSNIAQCRAEYDRSEDIDGVKACLVNAMSLDPNNPEIAGLISEVTARNEAGKIRAKLAQERLHKIERGKELFNKAKSLHKSQSWLKAIEAYENHIHSGLPDPDGLVRKSERSLAAIENQIRNKKDKLFGEAQAVYKSNRIRDAINLARKAQTVDPYDPRISNFLFDLEKELKNRMKEVFMDSVIEERYGNLEASRLKWEEILKKDVQDGEYYKKAERKLKQYGYKY